MRRNNLSHFKPFQYEENLSPFGRQVLKTLITQRKTERDRSQINLMHQHQPRRHNYAHNRILTFEESHSITPNRVLLIEPPAGFEDISDERPFEFPSIGNISPMAQRCYESIRPLSPPTTLLTTPRALPPAVPVAVPTSTELVTAAASGASDNQNEFTRDDLILSKRNILHQAFHNALGDNGNFSLELRFDVNETRNNGVDKINVPKVVDWENMFDTELLSSRDASTDKSVVIGNNLNTDNHSDINYSERESDPNEKTDNTNDRPKSINDDKKPKRKTQIKLTDAIPKKVKKCSNNVIRAKVDIKPKTFKNKIQRKDKCSESVQNWVNEVDPNHPVEECAEFLDVDNCQLQKTKDNKKEVVVRSVKPNTTKKVIQAQLANKGGIMKFDKPKNVDHEMKETRAVFTKTEEKDRVKDKKSKPKFVAPIKSQIPVKDITYKVLEIETTNVEELKLSSVKDKEITTILLYSNGFCQLNSHHTEDSCNPKGLLFHISDDVFIYLEATDSEIKRILSTMLKDNTIVCYDGKAILNFLTKQLDLEFDTNFKIIDIKVAGSLLEPDSLPENFTELQSSSGCAAEFTVATECPRQKAAWYAGLLRDAAAALRLKLLEESLWDLFINTEMRLLPIITDMERRGIRVDVEKLKSMGGVLLEKIKRVEAACHAAAGRHFQVSSPARVRALLYDDLRLDGRRGRAVPGTPSTGAKSTSETTLKSLASMHPLPKLILEYRQLQKAHATFVAGILQHERGGVIRPTWIQNAAATGRIACSSPNLQAIPKVPFNVAKCSGDDGQGAAEDEAAAAAAAAPLLFRGAFLGGAGLVLLAADWRHVECRVFARAAADAALERALHAPDLFRRLAADWLGRPEAEVSPRDRERAKRLVYARLYGAGARTLMDILDLDYPRALQVAASFDKTFPALRSFGRGVCERARAAGGRVVAPSGRARRLPRLNDSDAAARAQAERQALNFVVQGSAADVCKAAMVRASAALAARGLRARLLLQIHDELVWEVAPGDLPRAAEVIRSAMETSGACVGLHHLPVALAAGLTWGTLEPYTPPRDQRGPCSPEHT